MDSKMSSSNGFISIGIKATNLLSFISFILWCICYSWIITFQDFYSCFRRVFQIVSFILFDSYKSLWGCPSEINASISKETCPLREVRLEMPMITREDIELVMENLGLFHNADEHRPQETCQNSVEIVSVFDKREPSMDEVRQAFDLFDQNKDGFIDAEELKKVMNSIGLNGFSGQECQRMIMAFDENGDGKIDFGEFVKLMEECSC